MPAYNYPMAKRRKAGIYSTDYAAESRHKLGAWLKDLREKAGHTQMETIEALALGGSSSLSGVETGRYAIPPESMERIADFYGVDRVEFGKKVLYLTNPWLYAMIFGADARLRKIIRDIPERKVTDD